jgi:hypothetical protein
MNNRIDWEKWPDFGKKKKMSGEHIEREVNSAKLQRETCSQNRSRSTEFCNDWIPMIGIQS